jgi:hypothetical protein
MSPRRNPEIAVVVMWQNGSEGYFSARLAARVIEAYVDKERIRDHNLMRVASKNNPATSTPAASGNAKAKTAPEVTKPKSVGRLQHPPVAPAPSTEMAALWTASVAHPADSAAKHLPARITAAFDMPKGTTLQAGTFLLPTPTSSDDSHYERSAAK